MHSVTVPAFRLGKYEVTFAQWDACVATGAVGVTRRTMRVGAEASGRLSMSPGRYPRIH